MESKIQYYDWAYNIDIIFFFYCDNNYNNKIQYLDVNTEICWFQYLDVNTESVGRVTLQ